MLGIISRTEICLMNDKRLRQVVVITVIFIFNVGSLAESDTVNPSLGGLEPNA